MECDLYKDLREKNIPKSELNLGKKEKDIGLIRVQEREEDKKKIGEWLSCNINSNVKSG